MKFQLFTLLDFIPEFHNEKTFLGDSLDVMVRAEQLGFEGVWVGEEHFYTFGLCPSPQVFLAALAGRTSVLRLGTAVSVLTLDHPLRIAEDFALLDVVSNGRVNFGAGRGGIPQHFPPLQIDPKTAAERYEEALAIIKLSWQGKPFSYEGKYWQIPECALSPQPLQKPMPIYNARLSREGYQHVGKEGDGIFMSLVPGQEEELRISLDLYRKNIAAAGHSFVPPTSLNMHLYLHPDRDLAMEEAIVHMDRYSSHIMNMSFPGKDAHSAKMREDMRRLLPSPEHALIGNPDDICKKIHEVRDMFQLDNMGINIQAGGRDFKRVREQLELFAKEVMPEFSKVEQIDPMNKLRAA